jgi:hypothetical protein
MPFGPKQRAGLSGAFLRRLALLHLPEEDVRSDGLFSILHQAFDRFREPSNLVLELVHSLINVSAVPLGMLPGRAALRMMLVVPAGRPVAVLVPAIPGGRVPRTMVPRPVHPIRSPLTHHRVEGKRRRAEAATVGKGPLAIAARLEVMVHPLMVPFAMMHPGVMHPGVVHPLVVHSLVVHSAMMHPPVVHAVVHPSVVHPPVVHPPVVHPVVHPPVTPARVPHAGPPARRATVVAASHVSLVEGRAAATH